LLYLNAGIQVVDFVRKRLMNGVAPVNQRSTKFLVTNPSPIPRKLTGIGGQYFLYRCGTKSTYQRKRMIANEGGDW
jgi:hypothetical protein